MTAFQDIGSHWTLDVKTQVSAHHSPWWPKNAVDACIREKASHCMSALFLIHSHVQFLRFLKTTVPGAKENPSSDQPLMRYTNVNAF